MGKKFDFDYIIIGSGPAGTTAALNLAKTKNIRKKVAIVESKEYGGSNLNSRDIPYLVSLNFAHNFYNLKKSPELTDTPHFNFSAITDHQNKVAKSLGANNKKIYENIGITCIDGFAKFLDSNTIIVNNKKITSDYFILATGTQLNTSHISGLSSANYFTPENVIKLQHQPKFILVIGGGSTGCEITEYFAKLGTKVILMESSARILPKEDKEASELLCSYFERELGVMVMENSKVVEISKDEKSQRVIFSTNGQNKMVRIDSVVLATGSSPCTNYGLENAGVKFNKTGIIVDKFFQTSARNIFAIGDCISNNSSTERAEYEAFVLSDNLIHKAKTPIIHNGFARITSTNPEIATVGKTEATLIKNKTKYKKSIVYLKDIPASQIYHAEYGFAKIITDLSGHIIGATVISKDASLMITELALAIRHHLTALEIASTPHIANNFNYIIKLAAKKLAK